MCQFQSFRCFSQIAQIIADSTFLFSAFICEICGKINTETLNQNLSMIISINIKRTPVKIIKALRIANDLRR
jgi:hypothetical protein